ncbi:predicted protein [Streptomyces viridosporus ATCC 14672]|uniref:Predicted protein n=1 Tax=Streptomyces viridosporus (strain ATCC 14672 / DSM 40746 / JCM 4963 / KCTC 9882 / NRRL B-12104 / FH 1290) TaxID=566461 RepID=D5ZU58_STRV1|nr:predicted protein [Streptomyces viridosporus ATCC 14672]
MPLFVPHAGNVTDRHALGHEAAQAHRLRRLHEIAGTESLASL